MDTIPTAPTLAELRRQWELAEEAATAAQDALDTDPDDLSLRNDASTACRLADSSYTAYITAYVQKGGRD